MKEIKIKNHSILLYDALDEMPVVRYHKFTQLMVLAAGVGNDLNAIRTKLLSIRQMIEDNTPEKAKVEILNLYQTFAFIDKVTDPRSLAMACAVHSIDGEEQTDTSGDGLQKVADRLNGWMSVKERDDATAAVKKKMEDELAYFYPEHVDHDGEGMALMKRMLERRLERIKDGDDLEKEDPELKQLERRMRDRQEVTDYQDYERMSDTAFEQGCLAITGELHKDAKTMSTMEYHSAIKLLEDRAKEIDKARKR